jgi:hypothetical protein
MRSTSFDTATNSILMNNSGSWCTVTLPFGVLLSFVLFFFLSSPAEPCDYSTKNCIFINKTGKQCVTVQAVWLIVTKLLQPISFELKRKLNLTGT